MDSGGEKKNVDFYAVLGLKKECSESELRNAYKKLAMRWHPDRCSSSEAKAKFQAIQEAYSVLSDSNKRFLYDVGVYESDDDENGMGDFLSEMAQMMSQTKPNENGGQETFEELQQLFVDMFQSDLDVGFGSSGPSSYKTNGYDRFSGSSSSPCNGNNGINKRDNSAMNSVKTGIDSSSGAFCLGSNDPGQSLNGRRGSNNSNSKRRNGRKQKVSAKHDVPSIDSQISA